MFHLPIDCRVTHMRLRGMGAKALSHPLPKAGIDWPTCMDSAGFFAELDCGAACYQSVALEIRREPLQFWGAVKAENYAGRRVVLMWQELAPPPAN